MNTIHVNFGDPIGTAVGAGGAAIGATANGVNQVYQATGGAAVNGVEKDPGWILAGAVAGGACIAFTTGICLGVMLGAAGYVAANGVTNEFDGKGWSHFGDGLNPVDLVTNQVAGGITGGFASAGLSLPALVANRGILGAVTGGLSDAFSQSAGGRWNPNELFGAMGFGAISVALPIPLLPSALVGMASAVGQGWATWTGPH
jgi:hypothetical protein